MKKKTGDDHPVVETKKLAKHYGSSHALDGLDIKVPKNSIYGLVGPNGAGKTTTLGILSTLVMPTSGSAKVAGHDVTKEPLRVKEKIGLLPQGAALYPKRTAVDVISFYSKLAGVDDPSENAHSLLDRVGLKKHKDKEIREMSNGMVKLTGIAQALIGGPLIIMLDEATAGLDPRAAYNIRKLVRDLKKESTVIFSSHNLYEVQDLCDHVGIIHKGKLVVEGKTKDITKKKKSLEKVFMEKIKA
ncbi:MAG: ABC transporter ATP-binding protein [Candidatus Woesearchaeota archaeon]